MLEPWTWKGDKQIHFWSNILADIVSKYFSPNGPIDKDKDENVKDG
jgi:hypothetical protein